MTLQEALSRIEKCFYSDKECQYISEAWQTLKTAVLAQQTTNSAIVPCLCDSCHIDNCPYSVNLRASKCDFYHPAQHQ